MKDAPIFPAHRVTKRRLSPPKTASLLAAALLTVDALAAEAAEKKEVPPVAADHIPIRLATSPALSADGKQLAFGWAGDIWLARTRGGKARQLSSHPAEENGPAFSPDGKRLAFTSNRTGQDQVWVMPLGGGLPRQLTFHSEGSRLVSWFPDGESILVEGTRDFASRSATRFYRVSVEKRSPEVLQFNAEGHSGSLSPDGKRLLFCREGGDLYRKGYRGSRASQIWLAENLESDKPKFTRLIARQTGARSPLWKPDGSGFYYLGDHGADSRFNVWERDLKSGKESPLTAFAEDPAIRPAISRDGSVIVFRKEFEFFRLPLDAAGAKAKARRIQLNAAGDALPDQDVRRSLSKATNVSFSKDGLEIAFVAGGDLWVMDTTLREPIAITQTPEEEREPVFSSDGKTIFFIRDAGDQADLYTVKRADEKAYWWRNRKFSESRLTKDGAAKADLQESPDGKQISWISGRGDLWVSSADGSDSTRMLESWNRPDYEWSPDSKWFAWAVSDNDFNRDVWIAPLDGKRAPYNVSRHPDYDGSPHWSPDGKILAFTGRRFETETDIYYVYLSEAEEQKDKRDRTLVSALEKMAKARKKPASTPPAKPTSVDTPPSPKTPPTGKEPATPPKKPETPPQEPAPASPGKDPDSADKEEEKKDTGSEPKTEKPELVIDLDRLYERIKRISIPDAAEGNLFWAHDSKRLAFSSEIKGVKGTFFVTFPDKLSPSSLSSKQGSFARWIARDDTILWLVDGVPSTRSKGKTTTHSFTARQEFQRPDYWNVAFLRIWRTMRDIWYDEHLNNLDWDAIREKYETAASEAIDSRSFDRVVAMMLGELNGSHLGFRSSASSQSYRPSDSWKAETAHLGLLFDPQFPGPGLKVTQVVPDGPADQVDSRVKPGEIILKIDGVAVSRKSDLSAILDGIPGRDIRLTMKAVVAKEAAGKKPAQKEGAPRDDKPRELVLRPLSYASARTLMKAAHLDELRAQVDRLSKGTIGYVYVPRMAWSEFIKFEEEIFARGAGKDGLIIDVRDNGGGFTTDHLLTVLTPPQHAITVPRGGGPGYPQDRMVYATWNKPITVLCNQNSFSNAEIFSHAIKELGRGKLVGVPTAGGVISTGSTRIMDLGTLRTPFRGWFRKSDGADMELNGAVPDYLVHVHPADFAAGRDRQLVKAIGVLRKEIEVAKAAPPVELIPASRRD